MSASELPEALAKRITSWRVILTAGCVLLVSGAAAGLFSQRFASAAKFDEHVEKFDKHVDEERAARAKLSERAGKLEAVESYIHEDLERVLEQERENAKAVGARVVPRPDHER